MDTDRTNGTGTLRYSDIFLAMYSDNGMSCLHRNHSHVLVSMYSGELEINERNRITRLHRGDCAFIRKDFGVQLTKQAWKGEQFKATFKRDFRKVSDLSPQKWLIRRRLEAAREQILSGNRKVTEVCFDVGFKNLSHFSRAYKTMFGCSPSTVSEPRAEPPGKQI